MNESRTHPVASRTDGVVIRFSRRELELVWAAVNSMALPADPDDQRLVLDLRGLLEREVAAAKAAK